MALTSWKLNPGPPRCEAVALNTMIYRWAAVVNLGCRLARTATLCPSPPSFVSSFSISHLTLTTPFHFEIPSNTFRFKYLPWLISTRIWLIKSCCLVVVVCPVVAVCSASLHISTEANTDSTVGTTQAHQNQEWLCSSGLNPDPNNIFSIATKCLRLLIWSLLDTLYLIESFKSFTWWHCEGYKVKVTIFWLR